MDENLKAIYDGVVEGDNATVQQVVKESLEAGASAPSILNEALIPAMAEVGRLFEEGEYFVPEMLIAAKAMSKGVEVLKPHLAGEASLSLGTCIIGTVQGDLHDIGKNLVAMMVGSAGFNVVDLGVDVPAEKFITAIKENAAVNLVACSGLLSTTMPAMKETVRALKTCGLTGFKVLVGGAPVTKEFAAEIGADAYAPDAGSAALKAKELVMSA